MANKLGLKEARSVVEAMLQAATEKNLRFAAAVVDSGGELVFMARMDGAGALNAGLSVNKAYTAAKWGQDTKDNSRRSRHGRWESSCRKTRPPSAKRRCPRDIVRYGRFRRHERRSDHVPTPEPFPEACAVRA
jgi:hypothetical protein